MILDKIIKKTKQDLEILKTKTPFSELEKSLKLRVEKPIDMINALRRNSSSNIYNLICEVKKASPSKGIIREDFNPIDIAKIYEESGASCISVLTEEHFFKGSLLYLNSIDKKVNTPLLRKDFIIDRYQVVQSYINGADMILLIAKVLDVNTLKKLFEYARDFGMEVLVEIHDEEDLQKALEIDANIIGVNHRNLNDFTMDMELCVKLSPLIPKEKIIVAESGISDKETIKRLDEVGVDAFLVGEYFMRNNNTKNLLLDFITK